MLPDYVRIQIHLQVYVPTVSRHPFFHELKSCDEKALVSVCHKSMEQLINNDLTEVFSLEERARKMYFIVSGSCRYVSQKGLVRLQPHDFACEMVLWVEWEHRGSMSASASSVMVCVDSALFHDALRRQISFPNCRLYACSYAACLAEINEGLSDVWGNFDALQEMSQRAFDNMETVEEKKGPRAIGFSFSAGSMSSNAVSLTAAARRTINSLRRFTGSLRSTS